MLHRLVVLEGEGGGVSFLPDVCHFISQVPVFLVKSVVSRIQRLHVNALCSD